MRIRHLRMVLFFAVVLGIAGLCVLSVSHQVKKNDVKLPPQPLDRTVAEGLRLWNPKTGVDSVRFDSCRMEKMRMGFFALGGFNVLCIKGLVLNLPLEEEDRTAVVSTADAGEGCRRDDGSTVVESKVAEDATVTLTDNKPPEGQAFYRVVVSVP